MLWLQTNKAASGVMNLGGSLTRQVCILFLMNSRCLTNQAFAGVFEYFLMLFFGFSEFAWANVSKFWGAVKSGGNSLPSFQHLLIRGPTIKDSRTKSRKNDPLFVRTGSTPLSVRTHHKFQNIICVSHQKVLNQHLKNPSPLSALDNPPNYGRLLCTAPYTNYFYFPSILDLMNARHKAVGEL